MHGCTLIDWGLLDAAGAGVLEDEVNVDVTEVYGWAAKHLIRQPEHGLKHLFAESGVLPRQVA